MHFFFQTNDLFSNPFEPPYIVRTQQAASPNRSAAGCSLAPLSSAFGLRPLRPSVLRPPTLDLLGSSHRHPSSVPPWVRPSPPATCRHATLGRPPLLGTSRRTGRAGTRPAVGVPPASDSAAHRTHGCRRHLPHYHLLTGPPSSLDAPRSSSLLPVVVRLVVLHISLIPINSGLS